MFPVVDDPVALAFEAVAAGRAGAALTIRDAAVGAYRARREDEADRITTEVARRATESPALLNCLAAIVFDARLAHREIGKLLVSPADVDDAAQATAAAVCRSVASFRGDARFSTWVGTIARREALVVLRRARGGTVEPADDEVSDGPRLSSMIVTQAVLEQAMAEVGEPFRQALYLRDVEGFAYEEIAAQLGVPIGTVRSRIATARERVARRLREAGIRPFEISH